MDPLQKDNELLANIKSHLPELVALLQEMNSHWFYEDPIYRFYHQSFKFFLEMAVKYGQELEQAPNLLPSG
jgi:hypothetical protein